MRVAPLVLALALLATGCLGSQTTFSEGTGGAPTPRTSLLSQPLQTLASTRRAARAQCPAEYRESLCRVVRVPHVFPLRWALRYERTLGCGPDKGSYVDASKACQALAVLVRGLRTPTNVACGCAASRVSLPYTLEGRWNLRDLTLRFDACDLCSTPPGTAGAFHTLFPPPG